MEGLKQGPEDTGKFVGGGLKLGYQIGAWVVTGRVRDKEFIKALDQQYGAAAQGVRVLLEEMKEQQLAVVEALTTGDTRKLQGKLGEVAEVALDVARSAADLTARQQGKLVGQALWMAIEAVATAGATAGIKAGAGAAWSGSKAGAAAIRAKVAQRMAPLIAEARAARAAGAGPCFPAGTLVRTQEGLQAIQTVRPDDLVWGFDLAAGEWKLRRVVRTYEHDYEGDLVALQIEGERIEATSNHPFWVVQGDGLEHRPCPQHVAQAPADARVPGRWVDAGDLRVGDILLQPGRPTQVTHLTVRRVQQVVYNVEVEEVHTYAVGLQGVLVHNKTPNHNPRRGSLNLGGGSEASAPKVARDGGGVPAKWQAEFEAIPENAAKNGQSARQRYLAYLAEAGADAQSPSQWWRITERNWINASKVGFELQAREAAGAPVGKGSKPTKTGRALPDFPVDEIYEVTLPNGKKVKIEGVTDAKDRVRIINETTPDPKGDYRQLEEYFNYATENELRMNLIISPNTKSISKDVVRFVRRRGGVLLEFDPAKKTWTKIDLPAEGKGWSR